MQNTPSTNTPSTRTPSPIFNYNNTDIPRPTGPTPQLFSLTSMDQDMKKLDKEMETFIKTIKAQRNENIKPKIYLNKIMVSQEDPNLDARKHKNYFQTPSQDDKLDPPRTPSPQPCKQEPCKQVKFCSPKGTPQSKEEVIGKVLQHELRIFTEDGEEKVISNVKKDTSDRKIESTLKPRTNPTRSYEDYEANYKRDQRYCKIIELTETALYEQTDRFDRKNPEFDRRKTEKVFSILRMSTSLTTRVLISDFDYSSKADDFNIFNDIWDIIQYHGKSGSEPSSPHYPDELG